MLKKLRILLATLMFIGATLLFLDFTGAVHTYLGWIAKVQFMPALLTISVVGFVTVAILVLLTFLFGRIYCSVICPLGIFQDIMARLGRIKRKNPYNFSKEKKVLRYVVLVAFLALVSLSTMSFAGLLEPYSAFGRMANTLFLPVYVWVNNVLASIAEHYDSYMFYTADVCLKGGIVMVIAIVTFVVVGFLAAKNGRTWCNTICPVGTLLSFAARFSWMKVAIDTDKCRNCGKCAKNCKAGCIDFKNHKIDYSRCVVCGDCLENCEFLALSYGYNTKEGFNSVIRGLKPMKKREEKIARDYAEKKSDAGRRGFLLSMAMATTAAALAQEQKKVDGGLAVIEDKVEPERQTRVTPPGSLSAQHMAKHCTACQLCVSACPNNVLRPSTDASTFMQPYMSFENGYCRPECHKCSEVCPTGAIENIGLAVKVSTQVGHAVVLRKNCIPLTDGQTCGNCERHCPTGAIQMVPSDPADENSIKVPTIDETRCIGCGACENLCPARPFSAIVVEGHETHKEI